MSVYYSILTSVQASVETVFTSGSVVLRKKIEYLESVDTLPMVLIAPGANGEKISGQQFGKGVWWDYPVLVVLLQAGNRNLSADLQTWLATREAVRNQLFQPLLSGSPLVFDTFVIPLEAIQLQAFLGSNYDVTGWQVSYRSEESRIS